MLQQLKETVPGDFTFSTGDRAGWEMWWINHDFKTLTVQFIEKSCFCMCWSNKKGVSVLRMTPQRTLQEIRGRTLSILCWKHDKLSLHEQGLPKRLVRRPKYSMVGPASRQPTKQPTDSRPATNKHSCFRWVQPAGSPQNSPQTADQLQTKTVALGEYVDRWTNSSVFGLYFVHVKSQQIVAWQITPKY